MRVLQLHTRYREAGGEDAVVEAERVVLEQAGHEVHQHIAENPRQVAAAAVALGGSLWNARAARRVRHAIDSVKPDVAHVHNTWFALSPSILAALHGRRVPVVMTVHNYRIACVNSLFLREGRPCEKCLDRSPLQAVRHGCYRGNRAASAVAAAGIGLHRGLGTWSRFVDRFIVLSEFARGRMVRAGLPYRSLVLGSNFVHDPGPRMAAPSASRDVVFIGRVSQEKGLAVLLDAWRHSAPPGLRLVVIGDGPLRARLEADAPDGVTFTGRMTPGAVMAQLQRARALVIPSVWYEGQPVVALEGLAAGTPLVVSDIGGLPEILASGEGGWVSPPGQATALAVALQRLSVDAVVDERGDRARQRYLQAFTPYAAVARLESVYTAARDCHTP